MGRDVKHAQLALKKFGPFFAKKKKKVGRGWALNHSILREPPDSFGLSAQYPIQVVHERFNGCLTQKKGLDRKGRWLTIGPIGSTGPVF